MENAGFLPTRIIAGETLLVSKAHSGADIIIDGYSSADGDSLAYQFAAPTPITVAAVTNGGTGWTLTVTAAQTLLWAPGRLSFVGYVTSGGNTFAIDAGYIDVDASPLRVSEWKARLTAVDAAIASLAANPRASVSVGGISYTYRQTSQLLELRDFIKARLAEDTASRPRRIIRSRLTCSH